MPLGHRLIINTNRYDLLNVHTWYIKYQHILRTLFNNITTECINKNIPFENSNYTFNVFIKMMYKKSYPYELKEKYINNGELDDFSLE